MATATAALILVLGTLPGAAEAFLLPRYFPRGSSFLGSGRGGFAGPRPVRIVGTPVRPERGSAQLRCALLPSVATKLGSKLGTKIGTISPSVRNALLLGTAAVAICKSREKWNDEFRRKFYPGSDPDPNYTEPLPDGSLGCPLIGNLSYFTKLGDRETGAGKFYRWQASQSGDPRIFKYMAFGRPLTVVSGLKNCKQLFNQEFKTMKMRVISENFTRIFGGQSLLMETDPQRHQFLRRLVGQSMTPDAIDRAMPTLITGAAEQIDRLSLEEPVEMEKVATAFTLDVAWRQILGLDLREDEVEAFDRKTCDWIGGIHNPWRAFYPERLSKHTKSHKALVYLVSKIDRKIESLERNGPDGSTMSGMLFAKDVEDPSKSP
ncbi:hypothetical protein ACHAWF_012231 [Thalassiosira exigua]